MGEGGASPGDRSSGLAVVRLANGHNLGVWIGGLCLPCFALFFAFSPLTFGRSAWSCRLRCGWCDFGALGLVVHFLSFGVLFGIAFAGLVQGMLLGSWRYPSPYLGRVRLVSTDMVALCWLSFFSQVCASHHHSSRAVLLDVCFGLAA